MRAITPEEHFATPEFLKRRELLLLGKERCSRTAWSSMPPSCTNVVRYPLTYNSAGSEKPG
jgi:hypothetical protein